MVIQNRGFLAWMLGATCSLAGCRTLDCSLADCSGKDVEVALIDDAGDPVSTRGEIRYSDTLRLKPVVEDDDELEIGFGLEDGSFSDWQPVPLTIEARTIADFNAPDCDCTVLDGMADPVTVPEGARLID